MPELGGRVRERLQITTLDCLTLTVVADDDVLPTLRQARGTTRWELPEERAMAVCKRERTEIRPDQLRRAKVGQKFELQALKAEGSPVGRVSDSAALESFLELLLIFRHLLSRLAHDERPQQLAEAVTFEVELDRYARARSLRASSLRRRQAPPSRGRSAELARPVHGTRSFGVDRAP
jgi:hypothetical protein